MESDTEFEMQGQALPVAPFDVRKVDTTVIPLTSQEYMQQVMYVPVHSTHGCVSFFELRYWSCFCTNFRLQR